MQGNVLHPIQLMVNIIDLRASIYVSSNMVGRIASDDGCRSRIGFSSRNRFKAAELLDDPVAFILHPLIHFLVRASGLRMG